MLLAAFVSFQSVLDFKINVIVIFNMWLLFVLKEVTINRYNVWLMLLNACITFIGFPAPALTVTKSIKDFFKIKCQNYSVVLPNGVCMQQLRNYKTNQSIYQGRYSNQDMQWSTLLLHYFKRKKGRVYAHRMLDLIFEHDRY
ncbi:uncharacterized protein LOC130657883 [Hydractinia symbiolongicarpus]|uniref:uncharacterized protein LOC130657883 n=1 Tax=Hydractinia symbiolongicarpus TaxID=13093 RepID=UPI00254F5122|nr:uncharacterized protein LOC130657883 [Hydractinia symbiolongicarpus]